MIDLMSAPTNSTSSLVRPLSICFIAVIVMMFAFSLPPWSFYGGSLGLMLGVHLLLELFSIIVSILVVVVAWKTLDGSHQSTANILVYGFSVVAGVDLIHALSFEGMPIIWSQNSTEKAVFFWLSARSTELLTVALIAANVKLRGSRIVWLGLGFFTICLLTYLGNYHLEVFPVMFVKGHGVTSFKVYFEYALCFGNLLLAGWFFLLSRRDANSQAINLALACFIIGIGELAFTKYVATSDFIIVLGHVYKLTAYIFVFRVAFQTGFSQPYNRLVISEQQFANKQSELSSLISALPVGIAQLDSKLRYRYTNQLYLNLTNTNQKQVIDLAVSEVIPNQVFEQVDANMKMALEGQKVEFDYSFKSSSGKTVNHSNVIVPSRDSEGDINGVLAILIDNTECTRILKELLSSQKEITELQLALDSHAIVAITNKDGVITRVNDKFCEISQYSREELIGCTHKLINSGEHPSSFFKDLWLTISAGHVWNGDICNRAKNGSIYWVHTTIVPLLDESGKPNNYISIRADITSRKLAEQKATHMALHDSLTGLPNRNLMLQRLTLAIAQGNQIGQYGALLLLDIDHFKDINDTLGHLAGDELLRQVATRLKAAIGYEYTLARLGGDEFVVILENLGDMLDQASINANHVGNKILSAPTVPFHLEDHVLTITQSIGVTLFKQSEENTSELLKQADIALYKAKEEGRNRLCFYEPSLQSDMIERLALTRDLRLAIERSEFILYYQPIVHASGSVLGVEALLRWNQPERGFVSPVQFIPLAEQTKLILSIGRWVLLTACEQLTVWSNDPVRCKWTIAVNVSASQLYEADFVSETQKILAVTGANPERLRLELTESMLHKDLDATMIKMAMLRSLGIKFSLDDFGTGYSSLSCLTKMSLDQLKIDKSFVSQMLTNDSGASVVRTILSLASNLGLTVVAEGVELEEEFAFLVKEGCVAFQGYLFSRPLPVDQLSDSFKI